RFDLALAIADELQRDRLHAAGAQSAANLVPENRADLVADEPIQHAPRLLRIDHLHVDLARVQDRFFDRRLRDLVKHQALYFLPRLAGQFLGQMPADRLALAIGVGRDVDDLSDLGRFLQLLDDLDAGCEHLVDRLESVVHIDAQLALRQVADVAHRCDDLVVASQIFVNRLRLRRRLDDHQCLRHYSLSVRGTSSRRTPYRRSLVGPLRPTPLRRLTRAARSLAPRVGCDQDELSARHSYHTAGQLEVTKLHHRLGRGPADSIRQLLDGVVLPRRHPGLQDVDWQEVRGSVRRSHLRPADLREYVVHSLDQSSAILYECIGSAVTPGKHTARYRQNVTALIRCQSRGDQRTAVL